MEANALLRTTSLKEKKSCVFHVNWLITKRTALTVQVILGKHPIKVVKFAIKVYIIAKAVWAVIGTTQIKHVVFAKLANAKIVPVIQLNARNALIHINFHQPKIFVSVFAML